MKIALVHDYLREYGGAERVLEAIHEIYPEAPLYTSFVDWEAMGKFAQRFRNWDIRTSWVEKCSVVKKWHSPLRFLAPLIWESLKLKGYDVVISSSGWYICRGVITDADSVHISYIHHPPRNLYSFPTGTKQNWLIKAYSAVINPFLRSYDFSTAQRVDYLVANSQTTADRIKKFYRREAEVIYPPTEMQNFNSKLKINKDYYLSVGRLNYAKRNDLTILACNELKLPLKVVGTGKEEVNLRKIAGNTIEFMGVVSDNELAKLYSGAKALIFCALEEDFGIVPVEAMARGTPVIALKQGGVTETVIDGKTGVFFAKPEVADLIEAVKRFNKMTIAPKDCLDQAQKFSKAEFMRKIKAFVNEKYRKLKSA